MKNLISIIVPVYNAERTIGRCMESILAQTHKAIEAIFIVDGGTDGSADILQSYAASDPRVKVIEQESGGPATARNAGLAAASGAYIGFVDADDYIDPSMYERLLAAMDGAELANCGYFSFSEDGGQKAKSPARDGGFVVETADDLGRLVAETPDFIWDKLFDARTISENEITFPDGRVYGEDTVFLVKYLSHVKKAVFINAPLYYYNAYSEGSITNTISDRWYDIFENLKDILYYFRESYGDADFATIKPYIEGLCIRYYDRRANAMIRHEGRDFQINYVKYSFEFLTLNFPGWKERMRGMPGVLFPRVKTSLFFMRLYILAPGFVKTRFAGRISG